MKKNPTKRDFRLNNKGNPVGYKGYGKKIRTLAMKDYSKNVPVQTIAERYGIQVSTLYNWKKLQEETNSLTPRTNFKTGKPSRIKDEKLKSYIHRYPDHTLEKIAAFFDCSIAWISCRLKKLNIPRKKRPRILHKIKVKPKGLKRQ